MKNCIFCQIIDGKLPCYKIYEDDFCLAFLDIANDIYGHTLVIPKKHHESMITCDNTTLARVIQTCKMIGNHYVKDCGFDGYNIINANGKSAEQSVFHMHFHVLPRKKNDREKVFPKLSGSGKELEEVCQTLKFEEKKEEIQIDSSCVMLYTDGACSGNPGYGGWASVLSFKGKEKILTGGERETTNNRMELMAVIEGLESIKKESDVKVFSDSAYVVNAFNQHWIDGWKKNRWRNSDGKEVANKELWFRLLDAMQNKNVEYVKVKGHSDDDNNNRCDALARNEILKLKDEDEE